MWDARERRQLDLRACRGETQIIRPLRWIAQSEDPSRQTRAWLLKLIQEMQDQNLPDRKKIIQGGRNGVMLLRDSVASCVAACYYDIAENVARSKATLWHGMGTVSLNWYLNAVGTAAQNQTYQEIIAVVKSLINPVPAVQELPEDFLAALKCMALTYNFAEDAAHPEDCYIQVLFVFVFGDKDVQSYLLQQENMTVNSMVRFAKHFLWSQKMDNQCTQGASGDINAVRGKCFNSLPSEGKENQGHQCKHWGRGHRAIIILRQQYVSRKSVLNLAIICVLLYELLGKKVKWKSSVRQQTAFAKLKEVMSKPSVLCHYNPYLSLGLAIDASSYGVGATLFHIFPHGTEEPIAYALQTLSSAC
ncbi:hypothetical protein J437_LFUL012712 [Ladona fulva]|uniref:Reverse transcriptase/retrotransposon-derived protein RNase H-like domain-containing protein n=1 Tax=Ladona fulva TaxID=123851 RepID=A0A8K0KCP0_LADFU|nr:hypothetical protein J437_LFUL012712 [Ladona fulva]